MSALAKLIESQMEARNVGVSDLSYDLDITYKTASKIAKGEVSEKHIQPLSDYLKSPRILQFWIEQNKNGRTGFQFELFAAIMRADTKTKQELKAKIGGNSYRHYVYGGVRPNVKNMRIIVETLGKPHLIESFLWETKRETRNVASRFLKINRLRRLLTKEDMANALKVKVHTYSALEHGAKKLCVEHIPVLAELFGVEVLDQDWSELIPEAATPFAGVALREAVINLDEDIEVIAPATGVDLYTFIYAMCFDVIVLTRDEIDRIADYLDNKKLVKTWEKRNVMMKTFGERAYVARIRQKMTHQALANLLKKHHHLNANAIARIESNKFDVKESLKHDIAKALQAPSLEGIDIVIDANYKSFAQILQMCIRQDGRRMASISRAARVAPLNLRYWVEGKHLPQDARAVDRLVKMFDCPELKTAWLEEKS